MKNDRIAIIGELLNLSRPVDELQRAVGDLDWDYEGAPVVLNREHILHALRRHLRGEIEAPEIERWANLMEGRDDIIFESGHEKWIADSVFELANPILTNPLTLSRADELIAEAGVTS